ncbi:MAG: hypothetical protein Q8J97_05210, partial [Flavobacteriaceae bacterium]|nr:hypothetical protein [Flavobacteriaceae bacterium]
MQLTILMPQQSADAIAATATTSTVATAVVNPTAAAQVARVGGAVRVLEGALVSNDEAPSFMEMPLQVPVGGGNLRHYAGAVLLTALLLVLLPFAVHAVVWRRGVTKGLKLCGAVHAVSVQYFVPNCAAAIALLLAHSGDGVELGIAVASVAMILLVVGITAKRLSTGSLDGVAMHAFVDGC